MHPFIPGEILTDPYSLPKMMQQSTQNDDQQQPLEIKRKASIAVPMKYSHLDKQEVGISLYGIMSFAHNANYEALTIQKTLTMYSLVFLQEEEIVASVSLPG